MKKEFPTGVVLSITTGRSLCEFTHWLKAATWILGWDVFTHELADQAVWDTMRERVFAQHPALADCEPWAAPDTTLRTPQEIQQFCDAYIERQVARYGATLAIEQGNASRTESPLASARRLMPDKPILVVEVDKP